MRTSEQLVVGQFYSRNELRRKFEITDSNLNDGVFRPRRHESIWPFVTEDKTPDRIQYADFLDGDALKWDGQRLGRTDRWIIEHREDGYELLLFYRESRDRYPDFAFRYEGPFEYVSHSGQYPTHFILRRADPLLATVKQDLEAIELEDLTFEEGGIAYHNTSRLERNPQLRAATIRIHGLTCKVCSFNFEATYGDRGRDFIEVHHLVPVSTVAEAHDVNPQTDMAVVCANCRRMIHRVLKEMMGVEELKGSGRGETNLMLPQ